MQGTGNLLRKNGLLVIPFSAELTRIVSRTLAAGWQLLPDSRPRPESAYWLRDSNLPDPRFLDTFRTVDNSTGISLILGAPRACLGNFPEAGLGEQVASAP